MQHKLSIFKFYLWLNIVVYSCVIFLKLLFWLVSDSDNNLLVAEAVGNLVLLRVASIVLCTRIIRLCKYNSIQFK